MPNTAVVKPQPGDEITSTWGTSVATALNGIQAGTANVVLASANSAILAVVFPRAFTAAPVVVATSATASGSGWIATVEAITATGFSLRITARDAGSFSATIATNWLAMGTPA